MSKIRCCKCGSERLRGESSFITCEDCGNVTYIIPQEAVLSIDNPVTADNVNSTVTIKFDRTKIDNPRRGICVNDDCGRPCNVLRFKAMDLARRFKEVSEEWERFVEKNGEFICENMLDEGFIPADDDEEYFDNILFDDEEAEEPDKKEKDKSSKKKKKKD